MIFLTVGTQFPFDRLVRSVDEIAGQNGWAEEIVAQIGTSKYQPRHFKAVPEMEKNLFDQHLRQASGIISHAGMGTITMALESQKPLLVLPRRKKYGEVVNDHQVDIAGKFEQLGLLLVAYEAEELPEKMAQLKSFVPRSRYTDPQNVIQRISRFLQELNF
jgi:UDP-N-acetylglucosamine transferase subunit ALG13